MARPSDYIASEHDPRAEELAERGLPDYQVARALGIPRSTFKYWKQTQPTFLASLQKGRDAMLDNIEHSVQQRAMGIEWEEVKTTEKNGVIVERVVTKKFLPPDVAAIAFVLCNRRPESWKHVQKIEHSGNLDSRITIVDDVPADDSGDA